MRNDRINYVLVGSFVLVILVGLVAALAALSGRTGATDAYFTVYENVTGLTPGTQVLFEGYRIGQVEGVVPFQAEGGQRFRVDLSVRRGWPIPDDSLATISAPGLLAAFTLNIRGGRSPTLIPPGGEIPADDAPGILSRVSDLAGEISELAESSLRPLLTSLGEGAPVIIQNVETISERLTRVSARIDQLLTSGGRVDEILANIESTTLNVAKLTDDLDATRGTVDALLRDLDDALDHNRGSVDEAVIDLQHSLEAVSQNIDAISQNLEGASRNMYEFSRHVRQNPAALLSGGAPTDEAGERDVEF